MRLPRDVSGDELAHALKKYGYSISRQTGSHIRLISRKKSTEHHITIPRHRVLKIGTLNNILNEIAAYLEMDKQSLGSDLFR